jgi:hypothetical protein
LSSDVSEGDQSNFDVHDPPSLANKQLRIFGLKLSLDEFNETSRTLLRNTPFKFEPTSSPESVTSSPPVSPYQSAVFNQSLMLNHLSPPSLLPAVVVLSSAGEQEANVKWKINPSYSAPKVQYKRPSSVNGFIETNPTRYGVHYYIVESEILRNTQ